jgi:hypothetical protein
MEELPVDLEQLISFIDRPEGEPLRLLTDAVIASGRLVELGDDLVDHFVQRARQAGASWADIGQSIGVSKQAAQKRFVSGRPAGFRRSRRGLFTRFDTSARVTVKHAVQVAHDVGSPEITTLHLVLGLNDPRAGRSSSALAAVTRSPDSLAEAARDGLGEPRASSTTGHIPFADDAKKVLELALREAIHSESRNIGSEHILLGLLRDERSPGAMVLGQQGVSRTAVEAWLDENPINDH